MDVLYKVVIDLSSSMSSSFQYRIFDVTYDQVWIYVNINSLKQIKRRQRGIRRLLENLRKQKNANKHEMFTYSK